MGKYIDADKLKELLDAKYKEFREKGYREDSTYYYFADGLDVAEQLVESLQQEQPEPYFYCKYGGIMPLCSDCKRNHNNSSFKTEEITTWYAPSHGTKHCIDFIQQERPEVNLEKEIDDVWSPHFNLGWDDNSLVSINHKSFESIARHFFELGLAQKGE